MAKHNKSKKQVQENYGHDLQILFLYLQQRALNEKSEFKLDIEFFEENFINGCRSFFGVEVNNLGFPLWDDQEPNAGFLNNFICWYFLCAA